MANIRGTEGRDTLRGTPEADTIQGLAGDDRLLGKAGDDTIEGGGGLDAFFGELGNDRLFGGADADALYGGRGNDRVFGLAGTDILFDQAEGPDGNDLYDGGAGVDQLSYQQSEVGVALALGEGSAAGRARQGTEVDTVRGIEDVTGSRGADTIVGNSGANELVGVNGGDRLEGRGGNDRLFGNFEPDDGATVVMDGGAGDDSIFGGRGSAERVRGGTGADRIFSSGDAEFEPARVDTVDLGADRDADFLSEFGNVDPEADQVFGFGVDRVSNFRAEDRLSVEVFRGLDQDNFNARGFLDSNRDGRVSGADEDVRQVGRDLVLDIDALLRREGGPSLPDGDQHVVLVNTVSFDADQLV